MEYEETTCVLLDSMALVVSTGNSRKQSGPLRAIPEAVRDHGLPVSRG